MGSWAELHRDALEVIAEKITCHVDLLRFAAVCKPWRSFVMENIHWLPRKLPLCYCLPCQHPLPLLLQCNDDEAEGRLDFISILDQNYVSGFSLPELRRKWITGSSNGWLFTIEMNGEEIHLLNPFTRVQIPLPSLSTFQHPEGYSMEDDDYYFIQKAVISPGDDFVVMAIVSSLSVLSYCRPGEDKWSNVEGSTLYLSDVIPYKGQFYAINETGTLVACDAEQDGKMRLVTGGAYEPRKRYLVESTSGDLLHIARLRDEHTETLTTQFDVYKLETVGGSRTSATDISGFEWVKLESLGNQSLFLGRNCSLCLPTDSVPGCKRDCIYFTDDDAFAHEDCLQLVATEHSLFYDEKGVYDMANGSIKLFGESVSATVSVWFSPNPW